MQWLRCVLSGRALSIGDGVVAKANRCLRRIGLGSECSDIPLRRRDRTPGGASTGVASGIAYPEGPLVTRFDPTGRALDCSRNRM